MEYKKVGIDLELLSELSSEVVLPEELRKLEESFLFHGTLKEIISINRKAFQDCQRGQNGKSDIAKFIIDNGFVLPNNFLLAKSQIFSQKL